MASSPGPRLYIDQPDVFWSVIVSMWIGNIILLVLNLPLIPYIAKILAIPGAVLAAADPVLFVDRGFILSASTRSIFN